MQQICRPKQWAKKCANNADKIFANLTEFNGWSEFKLKLQKHASFKLLNKPKKQILVASRRISILYMLPASKVIQRYIFDNFTPPLNLSETGAVPLVPASRHVFAHGKT